MKKILFVIAIACFSSASAQSTDTFWVKPILPPNKNLSLNNSPKAYMVTPQQLIDNSKLLHALTNGNKVYALPLDNMPCIVPDMLQYNMPGLKTDIPFTIPNPAYPAPTKPGVINKEQLNELMKKYKK